MYTYIFKETKSAPHHGKNTEAILFFPFYIYESQSSQIPKVNL